MENKPQTQNKMGVMPVGRLILNMSLPMMFSMFILALYNIVDSMFIAMINEEALTALSLAFPVQNLLMSFSIGTGVGVNAILSRRLGEHNQEAVDKTAINGLFISFLTSIAFIVLGYFFIPVYLHSQTSNEQIIEYGLEYMHVIVYCCTFCFIGIMFARILQSTGKTIYTMFSQLAGAITNIILDPVLIFGIGPFPEMGVYGAAVATIIGQFASLCVSCSANLLKNHEVHISLKGFRLDGKIIGSIYKIAIPSIILTSITSVTTYFMNLIIGAFSTTAIAVYGSYFKLNSFIFMPVFGLNSGVVPIIAYNYGAKNKARIYRAVFLSIISASTIMLVGATIFELFPHLLLKLFSASDSMLEIGVPALRLIAPSFIGAAIAISLSNVFQAFGKAVYSMTVSLIRQIFVLLPVAYLFSLTGNLNMVWLCFPVAEVFAVTLSILYYRRINRKIISKL